MEQDRSSEWSEGGQMLLRHGQHRDPLSSGRWALDARGCVPQETGNKGRLSIKSARADIMSRENVRAVPLMRLHSTTQVGRVTHRTGNAYC